MPPAIQKHFHLGRPPLRMLSESWFYFRQMGLLEQLLMNQGIPFDTKWMEEVCCLLVVWFTSTDQWPGRACCCYLPGPTLSCGKVPTSKHRKPVQWTTAWNRWVRKCTKLYHIHVLKSGLNCYLSLHCWFPRTKVEQPDKTWGIPHPVQHQEVNNLRDKLHNVFSTEPGSHGPHIWSGTTLKHHPKRSSNKHLTDPWRPLSCH